jgi:hypothetical protein
MVRAMTDDALTISSSVVIGAPAETLYDMVADLPRMGEWSKACTGATWDEGAGPTEGAWFTGHNLANVSGESTTYDTRCEITAAERPATIAWMQRGREEGFAEWRYTFTPVDGGTEVTESWSAVRPMPAPSGGSAPAMDPEQLRTRMQKAFGKGIEQTLTGLKAAAEA